MFLMLKWDLDTGIHHDVQAALCNGPPTGRGGRAGAAADRGWVANHRLATVAAEELLPPMFTSGFRLSAGASELTRMLMTHPTPSVSYEHQSRGTLHQLQSHLNGQLCSAPPLKSYKPRIEQPLGGCPVPNRNFVGLGFQKTTLAIPRTSCHFLAI